MISDQNIKKLNKILKEIETLEQWSLYLQQVVRDYSTPNQGDFLEYYSGFIIFMKKN